MNNVPEYADPQAHILCLRAAIQFRMKKDETAFHLFSVHFGCNTVAPGLLRWCSNQSPGHELAAGRSQERPSEFPPVFPASHIIA
ncbi:MAG: hypothetical protein E5X95_00875 [Mesorhizobium sp.]|nr:MAG: hypothetical protein E5X95_00875 [Mesorhizobium sp.]